MKINNDCEITIIQEEIPSPAPSKASKLVDYIRHLGRQVSHTLRGKKIKPHRILVAPKPLTVRDILKMRVQPKKEPVMAWPEQGLAAAAKERVKEHLQDFKDWTRDLSTPRITTPSKELVRESPISIRRELPNVFERFVEYVGEGLADLQDEFMTGGLEYLIDTL